VEGVRGGDDGVHEGGPDAATLVLRVHAQGAEPEDACHPVHRRAAHGDVADDPPGLIGLRDQAALRHQVAVAPQVVDQPRFDLAGDQFRGTTTTLGERREVNSSDSLGVAGAFPADQHATT
jgi:hypothetical protein